MLPDVLCRSFFWFIKEQENDKKIKLPDNLFYISSNKLHVILINERGGKGNLFLSRSNFKFLYLTILFFLCVDICASKISPIYFESLINVKFWAINLERLSFGFSTKTLINLDSWQTLYWIVLRKWCSVIPTNKRLITVQAV
jgi:hypothetical protein